MMVGIHVLHAKIVCTHFDGANLVYMDVESMIG